MCRLVTLLTFLLVVHLSLFKVHANPIACFIKKERAQPVALAHGVVLNRRYILTIKKPLTYYPAKNLLVILGCTTEGLRTYKSKYRYRLESIEFQADTNLAIAKTLENINFYGFAISQAHVQPHQTFKECHVTFSIKRNKIYNYELLHAFGVTTNLVKIWANEATDPTLYATTKVDRDIKLCTFDSGLPVFCEFGVVGLLEWPQQCIKPASLCHDECISVTEGSFLTFAFLNFYQEKKNNYTTSLLNNC